MRMLLPGVGNPEKMSPSLSKMNDSNYQGSQRAAEGWGKQP